MFVVFVGAHDVNVNKHSVSNSNQHHRDMQMLHETKLALEKFYEPWNEKLGLLINDDGFNYNIHVH